MQIKGRENYNTFPKTLLVQITRLKTKYREAAFSFCIPEKNINPKMN